MVGGNIWEFEFGVEGSGFCEVPMVSIWASTSRVIILHIASKVHYYVPMTLHLASRAANMWRMV